MPAGKSELPVAWFVSVLYINSYGMTMETVNDNLPTEKYTAGNQILLLQVQDFKPRISYYICDCVFSVLFIFGAVMRHY